MRAIVTYPYSSLKFRQLCSLVVIANYQVTLSCVLPTVTKSGGGGKKKYVKKIIDHTYDQIIFPLKEKYKNLENSQQSLNCIITEISSGFGHPHVCAIKLLNCLKLSLHFLGIC